MGTLNSFATVVLDYPLSALKDSARPAYWVPDEECFECCVCRKPFDSQQSSSSYSLSSSSGAPSNNIKLKLHHCRQCGKGCCDDCSKSRKQVSIFVLFNRIKIFNMFQSLALQIFVCRYFRFLYEVGTHLYESAIFVKMRRCKWLDLSTLILAPVEDITTFVEG